ncbi:MAG: host-nuclease inhibitor Gam family protein [Patescibacteria group bacterium]|nr:host-nuclease inhibitor Gam family protein [Patescibacteria group bacterium]
MPDPVVPAAPPLDPAAKIKSRDEAEAAMAVVTVCASLQQGELAAMNQEIAKAKEREKTIEELKGRIDRQTARLEEWAKANRTELFGEAKTLSLRHGELVFKTGNRRLELLFGLTWVKVLERLQGKSWLESISELLKGDRTYVRVKTEVDKQRILADSKPEVRKLNKLWLSKMGLKVVQEEAFSAEPKLEELVEGK